MSEPNKYRPILFVTISSLASSDDARLRVALTEIAKQDPTIKIDAEAVDGRVVAAGMTQSHLEAIGDRLLHEYKLMVNVSEPNVTYLETIRKIGEAEGKYIRQTGGLGNYGHCKLRIEPNGPGKGYEFVSSIPDGVVPNQYIKSIDRGVRSSLELGILAGCPLVDLKVTVFDGSYHETDSNELAFELAGSIALREAAKKASPVLLEPVMAIEVEVPKELRGTIIDEISSRRGRVESMEDVNGWHVIKALVPLSDLLASTFQGLSEFPIEFAGYEAVPDGGWRGGTEPGVPAILPKAPKRGLSSAAASLDSETE